MIPLHRLGDVARRFGGGGVNVSVNVAAGGGLSDLSDDQFGSLVGSALAAQVRSNGGLRTLIKKTARRGL